MTIYCCGCSSDVDARLTNGAEVYPHRPDLAILPFWRCDACGNHVGCHHKTESRTRPLGNIATPEIKQARQAIHRILDPLWTHGKIHRGKLYAMIAAAIGQPRYHTAEIKTADEARVVYAASLKIAKELSRV